MILIGIDRHRSALGNDRGSPDIKANMLNMIIKIAKMRNFFVIFSLNYILWPSSDALDTTVIY